MIVGDQLTCKHIQSSKRWRQPEVHAVDRLAWGKEVSGTVTVYMQSIYVMHIHSIMFNLCPLVSGDFHILWECLKVIFTMLWGIPAQPGSLYTLHEIIWCTQVDKSVKVFNVRDEFLVHTVKAHLTASILTALNLSKTSDSLDHTASQEWLQYTADKLVTEILMPHESDDPWCFPPSCLLVHWFPRGDTLE